jgi:regulator of replication initiation timing
MYRLDFCDFIILTKICEKYDTYSLEKIVSYFEKYENFANQKYSLMQEIDNLQNECHQLFRQKTKLQKEIRELKMKLITKYENRLNELKQQLERKMKPPKITWIKGDGYWHTIGLTSNGLHIIRINKYYSSYTVEIFNRNFTESDLRSAKKKSIELLKQLFSEMENEK